MIVSKMVDIVKGKYIVGQVDKEKPGNTLIEVLFIVVFITYLYKGKSRFNQLF